MPKNITEEDLDVDFILVTHGHGDHLGDAEHLMKKSTKTVLVVRIFVFPCYSQGIVELCSYLESCGVDGNRMIAMNIGGTVSLANGISVTMVHAVSRFIFK